MTIRYFPQGLSAFLGIEDEYEGPSPPRYQSEDRIRIKGEPKVGIIQPFPHRDFFGRFYYPVKFEGEEVVKEVCVWDIEKL